MQKKCKNDFNKYYAKGLCYSCYQKERYWSDPVANRQRNNKYRAKHGLKSIGGMHKLRFGGLREKVIQRDGGRCVECGMTREQHKIKFGYDITVNHKDHTGRGLLEREGYTINNMDRMETLCTSCHGRKDRLEYLQQIRRGV